MLGSRSRTAAVKPIFPLVFNTAFNFTKTFKNIDSESKVHEALGRETVCCELLQWPNGYKKGQGRVLATYVGILEDLLYPIEVCISSQIDLLMRSACLFPGILSPKIEIVKKAIISKIDDKSSSREKSNQPITSNGQNNSDQQIIHSRRGSAQPTTYYSKSDSNRPTSTGRRISDEPTSYRKTDQLMSNGRERKKDSSGGDPYDTSSLSSPPYQDKPKNRCTCNQGDRSPRRQKPVCHSPRNMQNRRQTISNDRRASGQQTLNNVRGNGQSMSNDRRYSTKPISNGGENIDREISNGVREDVDQPIPSETRITNRRRNSGSNDRRDSGRLISNNRRDSDLSASNEGRKSAQPMPKERVSIRQSISNGRKNSRQPMSSDNIDNFQQVSSSRRHSGLPISNDGIENGSYNRRETSQPVSNGFGQYNCNGKRDSELPIFNRGNVSGFPISNEISDFNQSNFNGKSLDKVSPGEKYSGSIPTLLTPNDHTGDENKCVCPQEDITLYRRQKPVCHSPRNTLSSSRSSSVTPTKRNKQHSTKFHDDQKFVLVCSVRCSDTADSKDSDREAREPRSWNSRNSPSEEVSSSSHKWYQCEVCSEYDTTFENIPKAISKSKYKTLDVHLEGDLESMCTVKLATKMHERLNKILSKCGGGRRNR